MRGSSPVVWLLRVVHSDRWSCWWCRWSTPATVSRGCWGVAYPVSRRSSPLVNYWSVRNIRVVPWLSSFNLHLFVLNVYIMFRHSLVHRTVIFKTEKAEPSCFLLLLVVHDHHLSHASVPAEVAPEVCFSDAGREPAQENLGPVRIFLGFLHRAWVARFGVYCSPV